MAAIQPACRQQFERTEGEPECNSASHRFEPSSNDCAAGGQQQGAAAGGMMYDPIGASASGSSSSTLYRSPEFIAIVLIGDEEQEEEAAADSGRFGEDDDEEEEGMKDSKNKKQKQGGRRSGDAGGSRQNQPKALQLVDGKPRIDGILRWLEDGGIMDAVIIAPKWQHAALSSCLRSRRSVAIKESSLLPGEQPSTAIPQGIKVDLQEIDETIRYSDSACIRAWAQKNPYKNADLVVLPPEFLPTFTNRLSNPLPPLSTLLDRHRLDENLMTTLIYEKKTKQQQASEAAAKKKQKEPEPEADVPTLIFFDAGTKTLLDIRNLDDYEGEISMSNSMLRRFPATTISRKLRLSQVYITPQQQLLQLLSDMRKLKSFSEQVVPFLARCQWRKKLRNKAISAHVEQQQQQRQQQRSGTGGAAISYAAAVINGADGEAPLQSPEERDGSASPILAGKPNNKTAPLLHSQHAALMRSSTRNPTTSSNNGSQERIKVACIVQRS